MFGGFLGKLFGTDKAAESLIDNASSALDKLWYTEEEKAEDKARSATEARGMVIEWLRNTQGQNLARRLLALLITVVWLLLYMAMMLLSVSAVWIEDNAKLLDSAKVIGDYAEQMNGAMMLILAFYFAAPHLPGIANAAINKFSGSNKK